MTSKDPNFSERARATPRFKFYRSGGKRALDIALIVLALPILVSLIAILSLLIALGGSKPFYSVDRVGKNGRVYRMWKMGVMVKGAGSPLSNLGLFLQKSSLDELPQFFNVLTGDMSLVGPRPMMVSQRALYSGEDYYDLRPGITGLWQLSGQHHVSFAQCAAYDSRYKRTLSFAGDLTILAASVAALLRSPAS